MVLHHNGSIKIDYISKTNTEFSIPKKKNERFSFRYMNKKKFCSLPKVGKIKSKFTTKYVLVENLFV